MSQGDPESGELVARRSIPPLVTIGGHVVNLSPGKPVAGAAVTMPTGTGRVLPALGVSAGSPAPLTPRRSFTAALAGALVAVALFIALDVLLIGAIRRKQRLSQAARPV